MVRPNKHPKHCTSIVDLIMMVKDEVIIGLEVGVCLQRNDCDLITFNMSKKKKRESQPAICVSVYMQESARICVLICTQAYTYLALCVCVCVCQAAQKSLDCIYMVTCNVSHLTTVMYY